MTLKSYLTIVIIFFFSSCEWPYQKLSLGGGYTDIKLSKNSFKIFYIGPKDLDKLKDYALLRSAEVSQNNNFKFFEIVSGGKVTYISSTSHSCYNGICTPIKSTSPTITNIIQCYNAKPKTKGIVYNSSNVVLKLKKKYNIGQAKP